MTATEVAADWVVKLIETYCDGPGNNMGRSNAERAWDTPLIGFANGADPLFDQYKTVVGPFHWTPLEIWQQTFPGEVALAEDLTVISWVLPQTMATGTEPSRLRRIRLTLELIFYIMGMGMMGVGTLGAAHDRF